LLDDLEAGPSRRPHHTDPHGSPRRAGRKPGAFADGLRRSAEMPWDASVSGRRGWSGPIQPHRIRRQQHQAGAFERGRPGRWPAESRQFRRRLLRLPW